MSDSQLASNLRVICAIMLQYKLKCVTFLFFLSVATHRYAITLPGNKKIELIDYLQIINIVLSFFGVVGVDGFEPPTLCL